MDFAFVKHLFWLHDIPGIGLMDMHQKLKWAQGLINCKMKCGRMQKLTCESSRKYLIRSKITWKSSIQNMANVSLFRTDESEALRIRWTPQLIFLLKHERVFGWEKMPNILCGCAKFILKLLVKQLGTWLIFIDRMWAIPNPERLQWIDKNLSMHQIYLIRFLCVSFVE